MRTLTTVLAFAMTGFVATLTRAQTFSDVSNLLNPAANTSLVWGSSAADFNSDGWVDIYEGGAGTAGKLYLNIGGESLVDILPTSGIVDDQAFTWGGVFGDYNRDGFLDLAIIGADRLYRNIGNHTFVNQTSPSNLDFPIASQGPAWLDYNNDGRLDIFLNDDFGNNQLMRNQNNLTFTDISGTAGVATVGGSYGVAAGDFNNDGYADVFIATCNPSPQNSIKHLLRNNGDNTFTNINSAAGVADSLASWGVITTDYDNDGWLDLYIGNMPQGAGNARNKLYRNNGDETFTDVAGEAGAAGDLREPTFGVAAADFDNDGWVDLYAANRDQFATFKHRLYRNHGDGTFTDVASDAGISEATAPTVSLADFNNDGWMDIFIPGSPQNRLLFNNGGDNHWLKIRLRGKESNLFGVSARIEVVVGGSRQMREINAGDGFVSQSHGLMAHFGLGAATQADSVIVKWPGRTIQRLANISSDQEITIVEGLGVNYPPSSPQLLTPADDSMPQNPQIVFTWRKPIDRENDPLTYDLRVASPTFFAEFENLQDTTFTLNISSVAEEEIFTWNVTATDGHSIVAPTELFSFDNANVVSVSETDGVPGEFRLNQNYPNPFNPSTVIRYRLPNSALASLKVYDIRGREIRSLFEGVQPAGTNSVMWDGRDASGTLVAAGIYISKLQTGNLTASKKMILLR